MLSHEELSSDKRLQQLKREIKELFVSSSFIDEQLSQLNSELGVNYTLDEHLEQLKKEMENLTTCLCSKPGLRLVW